MSILQEGHMVSRRKNSEEPRLNLQERMRRDEKEAFEAHGMLVKLDGVSYGRRDNSWVNLDKPGYISPETKEALNKKLLTDLKAGMREELNDDQEMLKRHKDDAINGFY